MTTGSQINWPDAAYDVNAQAYNPALASLSITYDDTAGRITTSVRLKRPASYGQYYHVRYTLAKPQPGGDCTNAIPMVQVVGYTSSRYEYAYSSGEFDANSGYTGTMRGSTSRRTESEYEFSFSSTSGLVRQDLRCVMSVEAQSGSWYGSSQTFEAGNFCLGPCPTGPIVPPVITGPVTPTGLEASVVNRDVTLTWDASTDPNFAYFAVRRDRQPNPTTSTWKRLAGNQTSPTVRDNVPEPGRYYYYVTQVSKDGKVSAKSAVVRIDVAAPPTPTGLRASVDGQTVTLNWNPTSDPNFSHFAVRRDTQPNVLTATWTRIGGNWTGTSATDNPGPGRFYYYITQVNRDGQFSAKSNRVEVDVPAFQPPPPPPATVNETPIVPTPTPAGPSVPATPSTPTAPSTPGTPAVPTAPVIVVQGQTPVVAAPPSAAGQRAVSAAQALRQARTALRLVYKRSFTKGTRFKATCRRSAATRRTCTVSWRYKRYRYSGRVVVRLVNSAYATTVSVKRTRIR